MRTNTYNITKELDLTIVVEYYDINLGFCFDCPIELNNIPVSGTLEETPATNLDPSESDCEMKIELSEKALIDLIEEQDDGYDRSVGLIMVSHPSDILYALKEKAWEWGMDTDEWYFS